jgi:AAA family ATP:ADP antiporter
MGQVPTSASEPDAPRSPGLLDRLLRPFGDVRAGEAGTVLLMLVNIFVILSGYYVCKTAREPLIFAEGKAELRSYAAAGQALALMAFIPLYSWFASRVDRTRLVSGVCLFFALNLELFWLGAKAGVPYLGVAFFIWVGIFNNAIVAQFWSYGNDIYRQETGERLFPVIAIGQTLGGPVGAWLAGRLFKTGVGAHAMLHITAGMLVVSLALFAAVEGREGRRRAAGRAPRIDSGPGGFTLLARSHYLRLIAALLLVLNLVNTTGEYILRSAVDAEAAARAAADPAFATEAFVGGFYADYFFWVNVGALVLQSLIASRLVQVFGAAGVVMALPVVTLGAYGAILAGATFAAVRWAKTAENATDYSIMNTARNILWLPTRREEKYKAKQAADTFVVRAGDVLSAGLVFAGTEWLRLGRLGFAAANLVLVGLWLAVAVMLVREYRRLGRQQALAA